MSQTFLDVMEPKSAWHPEAQIRTHEGLELPSDADFFAPPPPEIGEVVTASTSLRTGRHPMSPFTRWMLIVGAAAVGVFGMYLLMRNARIEPPVARDVIEGTIAFVLGLVVYICTRVKHTCSYVGKQGAAMFILAGRRSRGAESKVLLFAQAKALYVSQMHQYINSVYSGTAYNYCWRDKAGSQVCVFKGSYYGRGKEKQPAPEHDWQLARSAEIAWTTYLLPSLQDAYKQQGFLEFPIGQGQRAIRLGQGYVEFAKGSEVQRVEVSQLGSVRVSNGMVVFAHCDSKWYSGKGKMSFSYQELPNGMAFFRCLEAISGIKF